MPDAISTSNFALELPGFLQTPESVLRSAPARTGIATY